MSQNTGDENDITTDNPESVFSDILKPNTNNIQNKFSKFNIENPQKIDFVENENFKLLNLKNNLVYKKVGISENLKTVKIQDKEDLENCNKYKKYFYHKLKNFFYINILEILIFFLFVFSVYLYILSLAGCSDTQTACLVNLSPQFFNNIVIYISICSLIISMIFFMIRKNSISKFHLFYILPTYSYLIFIYDIGSDLLHHGSYNRSGLILVTIISLIFIYIANFFVYLIKKKYFLTIFTFISFLLFSMIYISIRISDCSKWNLGLNNKHQINNPFNKNDKCFITPPKKCWVDFLDGLLDVSWYLQEDCQNFRNGERKELLKYIPDRYKNTYSFGYPITNSFSFIPETYHITFFYNLMANFLDLQNPENNNKTSNYAKLKPEIILNFDKKTELGNIKIEIVKNETLVKERKIKAEKFNDTLVDNILFIYVDSISRQHFLRKMKNTVKFLQKYFKTQTLENEISKTKDFNFYQFLKYHSFIYFTPPNINPMFYGESMQYNNGTHIIKHFHDRGFITGQSNNICSREMYDLEPGYIENLTWESFDHENIAIFCDPNFFNPENPFTPYMGPYSVRKRCLYGRNTYEYVLDYGEKFWETYINEKKFLRVAFQDAHEGTGEVARYLDEYLAEFLLKFEKRGWLENTAIFFVSDHGNNMIGFYNIFNCEDFIKEKTMATWFMLLPKKLEEYDENVTQNQDLMVTPYDIFDTMLSLINVKDVKSYNGKSVITEVVDGENRNCKTYKLDLLDFWCRCDEI